MIHKELLLTARRKAIKARKAMTSMSADPTVPEHVKAQLSKQAEELNILISIIEMVTPL